LIEDVIETGIAVVPDEPTEDAGRFHHQEFGLPVR
jgi:hypothetical protein